MKITIIGFGRLGKSIHTILRDKDIAHTVIKRDQEIPPSDLYYLTVPDASIVSVSKKVPKTGVLLHAAGSLAPEILRPHPCVGVLHPIMTFPGPDVALPPPPIPASISGDRRAVEVGLMFGKQLGFETFPFEGDRSLYHAAAVISGNFASLFLEIAGAIMAQKSTLSQQEAKKILSPLALRSLQNSTDLPLEKSLTGPASRKDLQTIQRHQEAILSFSPELADLYGACTEIMFQYLKR